MKYFCIFLISIAFFCTPYAFADTSIKAEIDKTSLTTGEALTYKVTIESSEKNIPRPELPKFNGFIIVSQSQSSSFSFAGDKIKSELSYIYILTPTDAGTFKIEPSVIKLGDKSYPSEEFEIQVKQGKSAPQKKPENRAPLPEDLLRESDKPQIII